MWSAGKRGVKETTKFGSWGARGPCRAVQEEGPGTWRPVAAGHRVAVTDAPLEPQCAEVGGRERDRH